VTTDPTPTVHRDIEFHETPERTLSLDVYEPAAGGPRPTVVVFHGGGFRSGEKEQSAEQARTLAGEGYAVVTPEYRLSGEATFPAALIDAKAAVEWCRAEGDGYGIDPRRIATAGYSAGANLAALVSVTANEPGFEPAAYPGTSSAVAAAVGWAGLYDCRAFDEDLEVLVDYLGGTREEVPEAYEFASPMGQTDVRTPPTLVVHGDADETLPIEQARRYADAVDALSTAEFVVIEGGSHDFSAASMDRTVAETDRFLSTHLASGDGGPPIADDADGAAGLDRDGPREPPGDGRFDR